MRKRASGQQGGYRRRRIMIDLKTRGVRGNRNMVSGRGFNTSAPVQSHETTPRSNGHQGVSAARSRLPKREGLLGKAKADLQRNLRSNKALAGRLGYTETR